MGKSNFLSEIQTFIPTESTQNHQVENSKKLFLTDANEQKNEKSKNWIGSPNVSINSKTTVRYPAANQFASS
jgi:hypothetical protein